MKDIILDRLSKMEDLEQRKVLKNILAGFFSNLIDYQEVSNRNLEERVFGEIEDIERKYDVYVTVCHKNDVDPVDDFLYPVFSEDTEEKKIDLGEIAKKISFKEEAFLFTVFMKCSNNEIDKLKKGQKHYKGTILTDKREYSITVRLGQSRKYTDEIEKLYNVFQKNSIPWKSINNPYANKFFDVYITDFDGFSSEGEEIKRISLNLEEYEKYKVADLVLLWNIERMRLKTEGFPMPAIDRVNYEHEISLKSYGEDNGFLVDDDESKIRSIMYRKDDVVIISPQERAGEWNILKITRSSGSENVRKNTYELVSNSRRNSFINKYAKRYASLVRTKGEIERIVNSFEVSKYVRLEDIEIKPSKSEKASTYDINSFIIDDIRVGNDKKVMSLKFRSDNGEYYLIDDFLSFIVSEVQMYFPEYECEGVLL